MRLVNVRALLLGLALVLTCTACLGSTWTVQWIDTPTGKTLFRSDDIVRFDWDQQLFELTREKAMDLMALDIGLDRAFVVRDSQGAVYEGRFVSPLSSKSYEGPVVLMDFGRYLSPVYHVQSGYHDDASDRRFSTRLRDALGKAGKLKPTDDATRPNPIERVTVADWTDLGGAKAWVDIFPETFRAGTPNRVHIRFCADGKKARDFESVSVTMVMVPGVGRFHHEERILSGKLADLLRRTHVVKAKGIAAQSSPQKARVSFRFTMLKADGTIVRIQESPEREVRYL